MVPRPLLVALVLCCGCPGAFHFSTDGGTGCSVTGCSGGQICSSALDRCVACVAGQLQNCSAPFAACDLATGECVGCLSNADCAPGAVCETIETHRCIATCLDDAGCTQGRCAVTAIGQICDVCSVDDDACEVQPTTPHCDPAVRSCVRCYADGQCAQPTPRCDRRTGECRACIDSRDCSGDQFCTLGGACQAP